MIYTSRFANPELKSGNYTAVRISLGKPRWTLEYPIGGIIPELTPEGVFGRYADKRDFETQYRKRLERIGVERIRQALTRYIFMGKDVALLCYEDVRDGETWCHRIFFANWWFEKTGERIPESRDFSPVKNSKNKPASEDEQITFQGF